MDSIMSSSPREVDALPKETMARRMSTPATALAQCLACWVDVHVPMLPEQIR